MANPRRTFYDDLGVRRNSSGAEVERAYRAFRKQVDDPSSVPDAPREARMRIAYETLSDPAKRAAYDERLAGSRSEGRSKGGLFAVLGIVAVGAVVGGWFLLRPSAPPPGSPTNRAVAELTNRARLAVNRVDSTDSSGKAAPLGIAFAIGEGTVATACNRITPTTTLTLSVAPQPVPVTVSEVDDKLGVCKLSAAGIGGSPLAVAEATPKSGDTVYVTQLDAAGAVTLVKTQVTRVAPSSRGGTVVETSVATAPEQQGGPVFDEYGRVVGVALTGEVVRVTPEWAARIKPVEAPAPVAAPVAAPASGPSTVVAPPPALPPLALPAPAGAPEKAAPKSPGSMTPEEVAEDRRRRLEEALQKNIR